MKKPVIAIVGRANVGKSTLFNRLTKSKAAVVFDMPGVTRDRHYGEGKLVGKEFIVIDTGGFEPVAKKGIVAEMAKQTEQAILESDYILFVVEATGLNGHDREIADYLRKLNRPIHLVINKSEGRQATASYEFSELGFKSIFAISSAHGQGISPMIQALFSDIIDEEADEEAKSVEETNATIKLAVVGRPNVGKSTLINAWLGENRLIAFDQPGTTRDAIEVAFENQEQAYTLIDTAGIRRKGKVFEAVEKFSVIKTLQAISDSHVVILLIDASQDISDQDAHIARYILESGRALTVGINKWDKLDEYQRKQAKISLENQFHFLKFASFQYISAHKKQGIYQLLNAAKQAYIAAFSNLSTPRLTRILLKAIEQQAPKRDGFYRPKLKFAHQGGKNPLVIIVHGSRLEAISDSYTRYLEHQFRDAFKLVGTPIRIDYKNSHNPYVDGKKKSS